MRYDGGDAGRPRRWRHARGAGTVVRGSGQCPRRSRGLLRHVNGTYGRCFSVRFRERPVRAARPRALPCVAIVGNTPMRARQISAVASSNKSVGWKDRVVAPQGFRIALDDTILLLQNAHALLLTVVREFRSIQPHVDGHEVIPRVPLKRAGAVGGEVPICVNGSTYACSGRRTRRTQLQGYASRPGSSASMSARSLGRPAARLLRRYVSRPKN